MAMPKEKKKRPAPTPSPLTTSMSPLNEIISLQDCYNFVSPNEYSDTTCGILAFLLRKLVGDINFSDILDEVENRDQQGQPAVFIALLENKRDSIKEIEASVEKCLMINGLIAYIQEDETRFMTIVSQIRFDMKAKMKDNQINQNIQYPNDFRQREADFIKRKNAQETRRLFYISHTDAKEPPSLIHLQNRTALHLSYLIDHRMKYEPKFRDVGFNEIFNILNSSFMITVHPHYGVNPVLIYERKAPGIYTAKVSVIIVSLLHDFMETHPNMIELCDIEPSLWPLSSHYKLEEPRSMSWKICHLQACSGSKPQILQYAELSFIIIEQTCKKDPHVHFAQALHSLKFAIKLRVNLPEYRFSKPHEITLECLQFAIGQHNNQIPQLLTRVILTDIKRFSQLPLNAVKTILNFMLRYFIHRTGVKPKQDLEIYLEQELTKAMNARKNFQTLEDISLWYDFLVPYVYQVEFMGKHPILVMFYVDGLFLGICNSARVTEVMMQLSDDNLPIIGLRFNSIKVDYDAIAKLSVSNRTIKFNACAVRVDIYNNRVKGIQNHTLNVATPINDISKFVSSTNTNEADRIRILSNFDNKTTDKAYKSYKDFANYYHDRLHQISKTDEKYKLITNIIDNINNGDYEEISTDEEIQNTDSDDTSRSTTSISPTTVDNKQNVDTDVVPGYKPIPYDDDKNNEASSQNVLPLSNQQIIQCVLSNPELLAELLQNMNMLYLPASTQQQQFNQSQSQISYEQQTQFSYQQPSSTAMAQQFQGQTTYQQQQQQLCPQQLQQQQVFPCINLYQPNDANQRQFCFMNGIDGASQQCSTQMEILTTSENILTESNADLFELITADQIPLTITNQDFQLFLDELTADILSSQNDQ